MFFHIQNKISLKSSIQPLLVHDRVQIRKSQVYSQIFIIICSLKLSHKSKNSQNSTKFREIAETLEPQTTSTCSSPHIN